VAIQSRAASIAGILDIPREAASRLVPKRRRPWNARGPKQCRSCTATFVPQAPNQLRCDGCRVRLLLGRATEKENANG
jgi:hypothetical protein